MAESTLPRGTAEQRSQAELLYEAHQRQIRDFRRNVNITWAFMLLLLIALFSGQSFLGIRTIHLDFEFIRENLGFIAQGIPQTLLLSFVSILLATILALLAALGRLSTIPPLYALSTFMFL
jgi:polar amino acid transport system permease protein